MVRQKTPSFEHTLQGKRVRKWSMQIVHAAWTIVRLLCLLPASLQLSTSILTFYVISTLLVSVGSYFRLNNLKAAVRVIRFCKGPSRRCVGGVCYRGEHEIHLCAMFLLAGPPSATASLSDALHFLPGLWLLSFSWLHGMRWSTWKSMPWCWPIQALRNQTVWNTHHVLYISHTSRNSNLSVITHNS